MTYTPTSIAVHRDTYFDFAAPDLSGIPLTSLLRTLSRIPRFAGWGLHTISVLDHSLMVSDIAGTLADYNPKVDAELLRMIRALALVHDFHEAFTGDIVTPLKRHIFEKIDWEHAVDGPIVRAVAERWCPFVATTPHATLAPCFEFVKRADAIAAVTEAHYLGLNGEWCKERPLFTLDIGAMLATPVAQKIAFVVSVLEPRPMEAKADAANPN